VVSLFIKKYMRVNEVVQNNIPLELLTQEFESWLDIGTGNGLVAQEWKYFNNINKKSAIDTGQNPELFGNDLFSHLDDGWEKCQESYDENSKLWNERFDLITCMDTIQYYYKPHGEKILQNLIDKTNKLLIIWTTNGYYPDNEHKSAWHEEDFQKVGMKTYIIKNFHAGPPIVGDGLITWYEK